MFRTAPNNFSCGCSHSDTIPGRPRDGEFARQELQIPITNNLIIVGWGHKLREYVRPADFEVRPTDWNATLLDGELYALTKSDGVVEIAATTFKSVEDMLGDEFVRVEQGILVARRAILVPRLSACQIGVNIGADRRRIINWVRCSREGVRLLRKVLPRFGGNGSAPPLQILTV